MKRFVSGGRLRAAALVLLALGASDAAAQSVLERSPNLSWGWTGEPGTIHLNTVHRFHLGDAPTRSLSNVPTLLMGATVRERLLLALHYSSRSILVAGSPNEWELFGRTSFGEEVEIGGLPLHGGVTLAYNRAAGSADGEVALATDVGPFQVSAALRGFTNAFDTGELGGAAGIGASVPLSSHLALAGDVVIPIDPDDREDVAWGAALQSRIPFTPHTLSFQATNAGPTTLQGSSFGTDRIRWGFEFTAPLTLGRFRRPAATPEDEDGLPPDALLRDLERNTVVVMMEEMAFGMERIVVPAGSRVVWVNRDPVAHTATADDGSWDSGEVATGESWSRVFHEPGEYPFYCRPHPFMTGMVVVEP